MTATPADGWELQGWTGAGTGEGTVRTVAMTGDQSLGAAFALSLGGALEATALRWSSSGPAQPWFGQTLISRDGVHAAQSGPTPPGTYSTLDTTVVGPARISFWWSASCRADSDFLQFLVNGQEKARRTGAADWQEFTMELAAGEHRLAWTYSRGPQGPIGLDAAWVDAVTIGVSGYVSWLPLHFSAAELAEPGISGPAGDPDFDGVPNLAEFALGTLPRQGTATDSALPRVSVVTTASGPQRAFFYKRPADRVGQVAYQAQWSSDLKTWHVFGAEEILSSESGVESVRILDPQPPAIAPRRLYRLHLTNLSP